MTLRGICQLAGIILLTLVTGLLSTPIGLLLRTREKKAKFFCWMSKRYCRVAIWICGVTLEARGVSRVDPDKGYIFMPTHTSQLDPPLLTQVFSQPILWVFKKELSKIPVFGWTLMALGQIMVDRSDIEQARGSMGEAGRELKGNMSVMVYPEGTRSKDGKLQPFKKGGFYMALNAGLPIVPVRISGSYELFPHGALMVRPGRVAVEVFDPIPTAGKTRADIPELVRLVRAALLSETTGPEI
jgi:1-acyl-sn-glycerol-3-phosphate acyltransferase